MIEKKAQPQSDMSKGNSQYPQNMTPSSLSAHNHMPYRAALASKEHTLQNAPMGIAAIPPSIAYFSAKLEHETFLMH